MIRDKVEVLAKTIWDYMHMNHNIRKADLIFVMGSHDISVADRGAELFFKGYAPIILVSGGVGYFKPKSWDKTEAEMFSDRMLKSGVPQEKILLETNSTNTGENVIYSKKLIETEKIKVNSVILVQKPYMERRAYATFKKLWPEVKVMVTSPQVDFEKYVDSELNQESVINIMVGDLQRIKEYPKKGFQIEQKIPDNVWKAYKDLVKMGYTKHLVNS